MSYDPFIFDPKDVNPGEPISQAKAAQRDAHDKKVAAREAYEEEIRKLNELPPVPPMPDQGTKTSEPVNISNVALYVGMPLLLFACLIWLDYLPWSEVKIFGYPLATVSFWVGLLCVAFRFMVNLVGIALMIGGAIIGFSTVIALIGGVAFSQLIGNIMVMVVVFVIGGLILSPNLLKK